jgi:two-component system chemotaxis response regulator CheB
MPLREDPIRVAICDDSTVIRAALSRLLAGEADISVVARATNGEEAVQLIRQNAASREIDVLLLDIEMPVRDGLSALPLLHEADPHLPVMMISTLTTRGAEVTLRALRLGAADYVTKPSASEIADDSFRRDLVSKIRSLARLRRGRDRTRVHPPPARPRLSLRPAPLLPPKLLAIGASTGGPQALFTFVEALGRKVPVPVVLTQHMPPLFTAYFAQHLSRLGGMVCSEARDGDALEPGRLLVAPGDHHMLIEMNGSNQLRARLSQSPPENFCRPSVDPMLRSADRACQGRVLVVMLTGMGQDGLAGTRLVVEHGGAAIAQDEATSVVWGMPGAIAQAGLCHAVLPLRDIAPYVLRMLRA